MKYFPSVRCPYCNTENTITVDPEAPTYPFQIAVCELENGGCDLPFVVKVRLTVEVTEKAIDGMLLEYKKIWESRNT